MISLAESLVVAIQDAGISHVFGVSGANIEAFHDALYRLGDKNRKTTSLLCKSERGASFMADGFARHSSKPAVCCSTSGGGMMNLAVGLAEARNSGVPVIAIVGCPPVYLEGQGAFQDGSGGEDRINALLMFQAISKYCVTVTPENFWQSWRQAIEAATGGFKGPSVLLIPSNYFHELVPGTPGTNTAPCSPYTSELNSLQSIQLNKLRAHLDTAERPLIIAGPDVCQNTELQRFCIEMAIPAATTMEATAAFPHHHPCYLGVLGVAGHPNVHHYLRQCDLVICLGTQLDIMTRAVMNDRLLSMPTYIINSSISSVPQSKDWHPIQCDPELAVKGLLEHLAGAQPKSMLSKLAPLPAPTRIAQPRNENNLSAKNAMTASDAVKALQPFAPHFNQFLFDSGNCASAAAHHLSIPSQGRSYIGLGMGGMGYAIAAAIGMRLAQPQGNSLVICGDGAFLMEGMEIHTAIELGLPILYLIFNDGQHGMCVSRQSHYYENRITCSSYSPVKFSELVLGLAGNNSLYVAKAHNTQSLEQALERYLSLEKPIAGVIELEIAAGEVPAFFPLNPAIAAEPRKKPVAQVTSVRKKAGISQSAIVLDNLSTTSKGGLGNTGLARP